MEPFLQKLNNKFENNDDKIQAIATLLGCAANFVEFIMKSNDVRKLDPELLYMIGLTSSFVVGLTQDGEIEKKDMSAETREYFMGEQTQERIYRTMKGIITEIYTSFQDHEGDLK